MSSNNTTARDRVWAAIFKQQGRFRGADVREEIDQSERPNDETIRRVLRAGTDLGVIDHQPGSPYYRVTARHTDGDARPAGEKGKGVFTLIDALNLEPGEPECDAPNFDPEGIDEDELLELYENKAEDLINEIDKEDSISDERASSLAQSGHLDGDVIPVNPSSDGDQLDFSEIEEHVRQRVRTFDPDSPKWATHVESLVDEVVEGVEPNDLREQSTISEWVRSVARDEVDD